MIPTMILFGLVLGRWWKTCLACGVVGWTLLLLVSGTIQTAQIPGAAGLALANTLAGVVVHQLVLHLVRALRAASPRRRAALRELVRLPLVLRSTLIGAIAGGLAGAAAGLVLGLRAYAPTAWFAVIELGVPATVVGAVLGITVGSLVLALRRLRRLRRLR